MENLKLLKKIKGRKIHEIRAEGGDMSYESGRLFCLEGKTQWYIHGEEDKDQNMKSLNVKNIFTNWPTNIKAGGPIKADKA